jgi:archaellum component FlaF (FlaF/FlaG flagellin family)
MKSGKAYYIGINSSNNTCGWTTIYRDNPRCSQSAVIILAAGLLFTGTILAAHSQQKDTSSTSSCPDLEITDIWNEDSTIYYVIKNRGNATASESKSGLFIDGRLRRDDTVNSLAPEESSTESFRYRWSCTSTEDEIKVCADHVKRIAECDEDNNCRTEIWPC